MAKFPKTYCSQCGSEFGPGDSGYSHCDQHPCQHCNGTGRIPRVGLGHLIGEDHSATDPCHFCKGLGR